MQEEYGIKLRILTQNLKADMSKTKSMIKDFVGNAKENIKIGFNSVEVQRDLDEMKSKLKSILKDNYNIDVKFNKAGVAPLSGVTSELHKLKTASEEDKREINGLITEINRLSAGIKNIDTENKFSMFGMKVREVLDRFKDSWREARRPVEQVKEETEETQQKMSGISISAKASNTTIVNGFRDAWKSIKKFTFSLLSLRGIYGLVRKASSAYMSQDTELAKQMQRTWASVGAMMAPIIETIVKWIRIGAAYLNYFIKALTGKDLIGKAVKKINAYNKSLGGTAKSAKALNKELTTLDEVTNLSFDDANTTGIEDAAEAFDDFGDIKLDKKVTDMLDTLAEKVKQVGKFLKPIIDWAIEHPGAVLTILGGAKLLSLLMGLTGSSGLAGLLPLLKTAGTIGVVALGVDLIYSAVTGRHLIDDLKEIIKGMKDLDDTRKANSKQTAQSVENAKTLTDEYKKLSNNYDENASKINNLNDLMINNNETKLAHIDAIKREINIRPKWNKNQKEYAKQIKNVATAEKTQTDAMFENWKQGNTNAEQTRNLADAIRNQIEKYQDLEKNTKKNGDAQKVYKDRVKELQTQLLEMTGKDYNARVSVDTATATTKTNTFKGVLDKFKNAAYTAKLNVDNSNAMNKANDTQNKLKSVDKRYTPSLDLQVKTGDAKNKITNFTKKANSAMVLGGFMNNVKAALNAALAQIPAYDVGTNYVPNDQLAMVHKGEAIVPKKFNNQQFFNQGNEETNALLVEVNQNLIELRNRPNVLEVNGKELAQATYSDYQNEGNRLNQSMTIKRSG